MCMTARHMHTYATAERQSINKQRKRITIHHMHVSKGVRTVYYYENIKHAWVCNTKYQ